MFVLTDYSLWCLYWLTIMLFLLTFVMFLLTLKFYWLSWCFYAHAPPWRPRRPPICLWKKYGFQPMSHEPPRTTWISGYSSTRRWTCTLLPRAEISCWCHMTSPNDVISPRQQPRKHVHVSPSPRQRHVIGWRQRIYCSTRDPTRKPENRPEPVSVDFDLGLVDFDFLRWPLTKSQNFRQSLSCSVFCIDFNFGLRFFIWNSKIGQLAHSSLWFLQRLYSWHLQEILSCLSNLKPSSSFHLEFEGGCWRYILDILA